MSASKKGAGNQGSDLKSTMENIEKLLQKLENSETPLEQSLECFEQGVLLIRRAQAQLAQAEQRVQQLMESNGEPRLAPFDPDEGQE